MNNGSDYKDDRSGWTDKVISEKALKGEGSPILRQICSDEINLVNKMRLCLFHGNNQTHAIFGGELAGNISPEQCNQLFEIITSEEDFYKYSEQIRNSLAKMLGK